MGAQNYAHVPATNTAGLILTSKGDGTGNGLWSALSATFPIRSAFNWSGAVVVPAGGVGDIGPDLLWVPTGLTITLQQVFAIIGSGTSATVALQQNGSNITGLSAMVVAPYSSVAAMTYTPSSPTAIANGDRIKPLVGSISGSPVDLIVVACYTVSQAL